jgi:hypothetical protein
MFFMMDFPSNNCSTPSGVCDDLTALPLVHPLGFHQAGKQVALPLHAAAVLRGIMLTARREG